MSERTLRVVGGARIAVGLLSLWGIGTRRARFGGTLPPLGRAAAGALAVRDLAQGAWLVAEPRREVAEAGSLVDVLHATSMLPVVVLVAPYRKAAAVSAGEAATWVGIVAAVTRT